jgi:DNA-directed RNA polymerase specialized sigma24 family protein
MAHSVTAWLLQLDRNDRENFNRAAGVLTKRYEQALLAKIRGKISPKIRQRVDAEDVLQSVLADFFRRPDNATLESRGDFWRLILRIAMNKVASKGRYETAGVRNAGLDQGYAGIGSDDSAEKPGLELVSENAHLESEAFEVAEEVQGMLGQLSVELREVAELLMEGCTHVEIAERIQRTTRTVERRVEMIREHWNRNPPE